MLSNDHVNVTGDRLLSLLGQNVTRNFVEQNLWSRVTKFSSDKIFCDTGGLDPCRTGTGLSDLLVHEYHH